MDNVTEFPNGQATNQREWVFPDGSTVIVRSAEPVLSVKDAMYMLDVAKSEVMLRLAAGLFS